MTDYEKLGGEEGLRTLLGAFIDRVYQDTIISFFFQHVDKKTLLEREVEFASSHLGGPLSYRGRPLPQVHRQHPINLGHFHRRLWLLQSVLQEHHVPTEIITRWLQHNRTLVHLITNNTPCLPKTNG